MMAPKVGDAERAAHLPEELGTAAGRHAEVAVVDRVLDHEHRHLHGRPDAQAEDDREQRAPERAGSPACIRVSSTMPTEANASPPIGQPR